MEDFVLGDIVGDGIFAAGLAVELLVTLSPATDTDVEVTRSPLLGEHSEEILGSVLGYSTEEIASLKEAGVV